MTIRRIKKKTGRFTLGQSQRSGEVFPLKEFIQDPVTGGWVHPTEADYDTPESRIIHPKKVDISVFPVLPLTVKGGTHHLDDVYFHGRLNMNLTLLDDVRVTLGDLEHIFYMFPVFQDEVPANINTEFPVPRLQAVDATDINGETELKFPYPSTPFQHRWAFAFHHSRSAPTRFEIGIPGRISHGLDAFSILNRSNDIILHNDQFHTFITPEFKQTGNEIGIIDRNFYWSI